MQHGHSARIRNLFDVFIPLTGPSNLEAVPLLGSNFGFALGEKNNGDNCLQYHVQLVFKHPKTNEDVALTHCFEWARRSAIRFQRSDETQQLEGIIIRIKLPPKLFDFRKHRTQQTRIQVNEIKNGQIIKQAFSNIIQILPKSRTAHSESTALIPVFWAQDIIPLSPISPVNLSSYVTESPLDELEEIDELQTDYNYESELQYLSNNNNNGEQYVVLYNGNAEVVGNFRALNFYKSSDINIKEDIRLLTEDHDCRDTLLQIDGVNYKFKKGVHPDTNRRFVGYIAQQVESVVPEAVQLIDGILHVDYESLIPYLSESIKQNYNDIKDVNAKADRIQQAIDSMYEQFVKKEDNKAPVVVTESSRREPKRAPSSKKSLSSLWKTIIIISIVATSVTIGLVTYFVITSQNHNIDNPTSPNVPDVPLEPVGEEKSVTFIALKELYEATNGPNWKIRDNWLNTSVPLCNWYGVKCKKSDVVELSLPANNLVGMIPESFAEGLGNLTLLNLTDNALEGSLPLVVLEIASLRTLYLSGNKFGGTIPKEYTKTGLTIMDLSNNQLTGTISEDISLQLGLVELNLSRNKLTGKTPFFSLTRLDLSHNQLEGTIAISWTTTHLNLANNNFYGDLKSITEMSRLVLLDLSYTNFNGTLELSSEQLQKLAVLDVSHTKIKHLVEQEHATPNFSRCDASDTPFICPLPSWAAKCNATCS